MVIIEEIISQTIIKKKKTSNKNSLERLFLFVAGFEQVFEKAGDSEGADAADFWSDGGEVSAGADSFLEISFDDAIFRCGASIHDDCARFDVIVKN